MGRFSIVLVVLLISNTRAILVQHRDDQGNVIWRAGSYRNRDVIPMPTNYDSDKKHRRDMSIEDEDEDMTINNDDEIDDSADIKAHPSKKSFIRTHFSLPIGAEMPFGYSEPVQPKGKKSSVAHPSIEENLADSSKFNVLHLDRDHSSRSDVSQTWGLTWKDPDPELNRDSRGYGRSKLEGLKTGTISEEEFDSGLMGRGLGGLKERAQNENLMEKKFADKLDDESDVDMEDSRRRM